MISDIMTQGFDCLEVSASLARTQLITSGGRCDMYLDGDDGFVGEGFRVPGNGCEVGDRSARG